MVPLSNCVSFNATKPSSLSEVTWRMPFGNASLAMNVALPLACQALATNVTFAAVIDAANADVIPSPSARVAGTSRFFISHYQRMSARTLRA